MNGRSRRPSLWRIETSEIPKFICGILKKCWDSWEFEMIKPAANFTKHLEIPTKVLVICDALPV